MGTIKILTFFCCGFATPGVVGLGMQPPCGEEETGC